MIPAKTAEKLNGDHPEGTRHQAAMQIAVPLIGNGMPANAVFLTLRDKFPPDVTDRELRGIVDYAVSKRPTPSGFGNGERPQFSRSFSAAPEPKRRTPVEHTTWWLNGQTTTLEKFTFRSQLPIPEEPHLALRQVFELLYSGTDNLNIVCSFELRGEKAQPKGAGRILSRDKWIEYLGKKDVPESEAGAWFRPNPCKAHGSGHAGAVTDSDIESFRFLLLESDVLTVEMQLALFLKIKLPIALVTLSGGGSAHGWVRLDSPDIKDYETKARRIVDILHPFGIDQANKNPSRLSRLPGANRVIGASGDGIQRLLWLNPGAPAITQDGIIALENQMLVPAIEEKPFKRLIEEAIPRYEEMYANRGKLGVPTGFKSFDRATGGLKAGGYTLIAAATGVGKSTLAVNMINAALSEKYGVVLFSLEMTREDITDMMFSINCRVDRNAFNTGEFLPVHFETMAEGCRWMKDLPLWVDDDPSITVEMVRRRTLSLCSEGLIGLAVVDYAQLTMPDCKPDNREQAVAAVALGLRLLSREAKIPIIVLSQLNDDGKVRESRKLTHEAATVLIVSRKDGTLTDPHLTMTIAKGRKIPSAPLHLYMKAEHCLITEEAYDGH